MRTMKTITDIDFPDQTLTAGTILQVEDDCSSNGLVYILAGKLAYRSIHVDHLNEVDEEELIAELNTARKTEGDLLDSLAGAGRTIAGLEERNLQLGWEIEARDKKVELPMEVAEAIDKLRNADFSNFGIIHFIDRPKEIKHQEYIGPFSVLRRFTFLDTEKYLGGCELLMRALVNGYTIAPDPEKDPSSALLKEVTSLVWTWWHGSPEEGKPQHHVDRLAEKIRDFIQQRDQLPF